MGNKYYIANDMYIVRFYEFEIPLWFNNSTFKNIESWKQNGLSLCIL